MPSKVTSEFYLRNIINVLGPTLLEVIKFQLKKM